MIIGTSIEHEAFSDHEEDIEHSDYWVHYWEKQNHAEDQFIGRYFNLDSMSESDHEEQVEEWLESLTEATGRECTEYIVSEVSDEVPRQFVTKSGLSSDFFEMMEIVEKRYPQITVEICLAGLECGLQLHQIEEEYKGEFDSDSEFAQDYAEGLGLARGDVQWPYQHIDWVAAAEELTDEFVSHEGHYFRNV